MLKRAVEYAKENGFTKMKTRTKSGVDFYSHYGWKIADMKQDDFIMEIDI